MTEADRDLTAYRALVVEHGLYGRARARMFEDVWENKPWRVDLTSGVLKIGDEKYRAELLGTHVAEDDSFLWSWANPGASNWERSIVAAKKLRDLGATPGHSVFREQSFTSAWVNPLELAYVCGELAGGLPFYPAETGTASALFLVKGATLDPQAIPAIYLPGVLLDFAPLTGADMPACAGRFLERLGFTATAGAWHRANGARMKLAWDERGRLTDVSQEL